MTLHSVRGFETFRNPTTKLRTALGPGRSFMSRGCGLATDQKAVRRRGPGRVVLGSKPQLATTEKLVRWATRPTGQKTRALGYVSSRCERVHSGGVNGVTAGGGGRGIG